MKFSEIIGGETPTLIDFYADWCAPCKMMPPILKEVKEKLGGQIKIVKIDTEKNRQVSVKYGIKSIPTMILFKEGKAIWRQSGVLPAPQLLKILEQYI